MSPLHSMVRLRVSLYLSTFRYKRYNDTLENNYDCVYFWKRGRTKSGEWCKIVPDSEEDTVYSLWDRVTQNGFIARLGRKGQAPKVPPRM